VDAFDQLYLGLVFRDPELQQGLIRVADRVGRRAQAARGGSKVGNWCVEALRATAARFCLRALLRGAQSPAAVIH
jgi:hypothetical protein